MTKAAAGAASLKEPEEHLLWQRGARRAQDGSLSRRGGSGGRIIFIIIFYPKSFILVQSWLRKRSAATSKQFVVFSRIAGKKN